MTPTAIYLSVTNQWRLAVVMLALAAALYFYLGYLPFILWILTPIALVAMVVNAIRGQSTEPIVVLNDEGVFDRRLKVGVIRWSDIRRIKSYSLSGAYYISLELHDAKTYESRRPMWLRLLSQVQRGFGMSSTSISTNALDVDHNTLVQLIHKGCGTRDAVVESTEIG